MSEEFNFGDNMPNYHEGDKETIKLIKNSRGYNWEIKLKSELLSDEDLSRLSEIDKKLNEEYGGAV